MPPNYVHKILHISILFYQSLSIISASGRKLLKMKNNKSFLTPSIYIWKYWLHNCFVDTGFAVDPSVEAGGQSMIQNISGETSSEGW